MIITLTYDSPLGTFSGTTITATYSRDEEYVCELSTDVPGCVHEFLEELGPIFRDIFEQAKLGLALRFLKQLASIGEDPYAVRIVDEAKLPSCTVHRRSVGIQ